MNCPECGTKMAKAGWVWSGNKKVPRYRCRCGKVVIDSTTVYKKEEK